MVHLFRCKEFRTATGENIYNAMNSYLKYLGLSCDLFACLTVLIFWETLKMISWHPWCYGTLIENYSFKP